MSLPRCMTSGQCIAMASSEAVTANIPISRRLRSVRVVMQGLPEQLVNRREVVLEESGVADQTIQRDSAEDVDELRWVTQRRHPAEDGTGVYRHLRSYEDVITRVQRREQNDVGENHF